jgi:hypothetical protein
MAATVKSGCRESMEFDLAQTDRTVEIDPAFFKKHPGIGFSSARAQVTAAGMK